MTKPRSGRTYVRTPVAATKVGKATTGRWRPATHADPAVVEPPPGLESTTGLLEEATTGRWRPATHADPAVVEPPPGLESTTGLLEEASSPVAPPPGLELPPGFEAGIKASIPDVDGPSEPRDQDSDEELATAAIPEFLGSQLCADDSGKLSEFLACNVTIRGLPNGILSEPLMLATLQQAGLEDDVITFSTLKGQPCGEASIALLSFEAAVRCVRHFDGCHWDASGEAVTATMDPSLDCMADWTMPDRLQLQDAPGEAITDTMEPSLDCMTDWTMPVSLQLQAENSAAFEPLSPMPDAVQSLRVEAPVFLPFSFDAGEDIEAENFAAFEPMSPVPDATKSLRVEAPAFQPLSVDVGEDIEAIPRELADLRARLSADAPAFVPLLTFPRTQASTASISGTVTATPANIAAGAKLGISSDTSTEMGDSDGEDEKGSLVT